MAGKRYPLNMRTTRELRQKIEAAARASGRSRVQEVEFRLEQSFAREEQAKLIIRETIEATIKARIKRKEALPNPSKSAYDHTGW